ncbi:MAG: cyanophycinase [Pirellulales bacterium]
MRVSLFTLWVWLGVSALISSGAENAGHLVIVGGGLRAENSAVYTRMIQFAGGPEKARFVVLPTASLSVKDSIALCDDLTLYGITRDRAEVLDVTEKNAAQSTVDPTILAKVQAASGVFISGGDQRRLVRALTKEDGGDTPLLAEIRVLLARGGVVGGTSAGASCQSAVMLAVSGLPDPMIDEGMDTLDFGIKTDERSRGLLIRSGFGFFKTGIIDQHFHQFRGRLGRLTRAVADRRLNFGFGIDENTALIARDDGRVEVAGAGHVTVIKTTGSKSEDGPLGYRIHGVTLTLLSDGDIFDPASGKVDVPKEKEWMSPEKPEYHGNFQLNDIAAGGAVPFAMINGLAENSRKEQIGICQKLYPDHSHGYRFTFRKRPTTNCYGGFYRHAWTNTVIDIELDIDPIGEGMRDSVQSVPSDLRGIQQNSGLLSVAFRGIMPANSRTAFRKDEPLTRGELASLAARAAHIPSPFPSDPAIADLPAAQPLADEILRVTAAGWMHVDDKQQFRPTEKADAACAARVFKHLVETSAPRGASTLLQELDQLERTGSATMKRGTAAEWTARILELPRQ